MGLESSTAQAVAWMLLASFALAGGINQVLAIIDRWKAQPPVGELLQGHTLLSLRVDRIESDMSEMEVQMRSKFAEIEKSNERRAVALHERINPLIGQMGSLQNAVESNTQIVARLDAKLDRFNERITRP